MLHDPIAATVYALPRGRADNKRLQISGERAAAISLDEQGQHNLPAGTKLVETQLRMCGDYYCMIEGKIMVSATGDTLNDAFLAALAKARAAA